MKLITETYGRSVRLPAARDEFAAAYPAAEIVKAYRDEARRAIVVGWSMTAEERQLVDRVDLDRETGRYFDPENGRPERGGDYWTAFCGGCGEEIDVVAGSETEARAIVLAAVVNDYEPVEIDRIERRFGGLVYF